MHALILDYCAPPVIYLLYDRQAIHIYDFRTVLLESHSVARLPFGEPLTLFLQRSFLIGNGAFRMSTLSITIQFRVIR